MSYVFYGFKLVTFKRGKFHILRFLENLVEIVPTYYTSVRRQLLAELQQQESDQATTAYARESTESSLNDSSSSSFPIEDGSSVKYLIHMKTETATLEVLSKVPLQQSYSQGQMRIH
jgi:hypothetical protein